VSRQGRRHGDAYMTDEEYEKATDEFLEKAVVRFRAARGDSTAR